MKNKTSFLQNNMVAFAFAMICCLLWGSAFPCIKIGYQLFNIDSADAFSQIAFGGIRFLLAGILAWILGSIMDRRLLAPAKWELPRIVKLCSLQTVLQYVFFYLGLARTTGVKASIIEASNVFVAILIASLIFHQEILSINKIIGCIIGFIGVVLINIPQNGELDLHMRFTGEGFILLSTVAYAFSSVLTKRYSKESNPVMLSAFQFMLGGLIMMLIGFAGGAHFTVITNLGLIMLIYLAFISAAAFSLWGILLKYNDISKVTVYGFMNPMFGVILSSLLLTEQNDSVGIEKATIALLCVSIGIIFVNRKSSS